MEHFNLNQLTKKNQEFIHIATNQLIKKGKTDQEIKEILAEILPTILEHQNKGIPARQILGAPTAWVDGLTTAEQEAKDHPKENDNPWLMWLSTSSIILGLMGIINGSLSFFSNRSQTYGVLSLILLSLLVGAMMYAMYHYIYRHLDQPANRRPSLLKSIGIMALVMIATILAFGLSAFIPAAINPIPPAWLTILIGLAGVGGWYYLKRNYNVKSALANRPTPVKR